jgi:hypothetical protein
MLGSYPASTRKNGGSALVFLCGACLKTKIMHQKAPKTFLYQFAYYLVPYELRFDICLFAKTVSSDNKEVLKIFYET